MTNSSSASLITSYYDAIKDQNLENFMNLLADNVIHEINEGETEIGKPKFKIFMQDQFSHGKIDIQDLVILTSPEGQYAMTRFICKGKYEKAKVNFPTAKGQNWEIPVVSYFKMEAGKITHVAVYYNLKEWLRQIS